ncbi:MAG: LysM peptidoglycan-binding domain-containing protein [Planctomycetota bacterium]|jgi:nucleoid-associated protein YgaU
MGRLEKQIIIGALALVGVLLTIVVFKGLKPRAEVDVRQPLFISLDDEGPVAEEEAQPPKSLQQDKFPDFGQGAEKQDPDAGKTVHKPLRPQLKEELVPPNTSVEKPRIYTIAPLDTLSEIAQEQLGSQRRMGEILELNPGLDPDRLVPGETLVLPGKNARIRNAMADSGQGRVSEASSKMRTHTVVAGDSLWVLADKYYGKGHKVDRIVAANPDLLPDKNAVLSIGWVLVIPE